MGETILDITMSLDGFVAGPNATLEAPLGEGGMALHDWVFPLRSWRAHHGMEGGETGPDDELVSQSLERVGAQVMGRRMFSGGSGPWDTDPNAGGWWGDAPPFYVSVFVVTHHPRDPVVFENGTQFVFVDGVETAVELARAAAGALDVRVAGGADVANQCLRAGLLDRLDLHIRPLLLGSGARLFDGTGQAGFELLATHGSPRVTHVSYRPS